MEKFDLLIEQLKPLRLVSEHDFLDTWPEAIFEEHFADEANYKIVAKKLDPDPHRWFETSITVIEIYGRFLGVRHVSNLFSESMSWSDCGFYPRFFEMKQVPSVTYQRKE